MRTLVINIPVFVVFLLISCSGLKKTSYKATIYNKFRDKQEIFHVHFHLPKGYNLITNMSGSDVENRYIYSDSSVFYIANNVGWVLPNQQNILSSGMHSVLFDSDTFQCEGQVENNLYWKEIKLYDLSLGYINASAERKVFFDYALRDIHKYYNSKYCK